MDAKGRREEVMRRRRMARAREALAEAGRLGRVTQTAAVLVGIVGPTLIAVVGLHVTSNLGLVASTLVTMACTVGAYFAHEAVMAELRLRRLIAVGRGLDVDAYLNALGENRRTAVMVVRATFAKPWPDAARASAPDDVRGWMPALAGVGWTGGDTLVLRSGKLDGTVWHSGGRSTSGHRSFDNAAMHGCFLDVVRRVVPHLEAVAPIARMQVELEGAIERFDATP